MITEAERELDALVAEKVMGWHYVQVKELFQALMPPEITNTIWEDPVISDNQIPHYSTSVAAAWEVVEKLKLDGYQFSVGTDPDAKPWFAQCWNTGTTCNQGHSHIQTVQEFADTAPLAICLAALKAVGHVD